MSLTPKQLGEIIESAVFAAVMPLLTRKDLARRYGRALDTIDQWHRRGILPPAIYLPGSRFPQWRLSDLARAEQSKIFKKKIQ